MTITQTPAPSYLHSSVTQAIAYADEHDITIPPYVRIRARRVGAIKAGDDLTSIKRQYHDAITEALTTYFEGGSVASPKKSFKTAMVDAFGAAFDLGWIDGGQELPWTGDPLEWFNAKVEAELAFIDSVFVQAKDLKKEDGFDFFTWVTERADGYIRTVDAVYNAGKMYAAKNKMLFWRLGNTEKHCGTCAKLDGQSHRASWYLARNYIPRQPGAAMLCGGYFCDCKLEDVQGNEVTV